MYVHMVAYEAEHRGLGAHSNEHGKMNMENERCGNNLRVGRRRKWYPHVYVYCRTQVNLQNCHATW